jgi:hypothetical protein
MWNVHAAPVGAPSAHAARTRMLVIAITVVLLLLTCAWAAAAQAPLVRVGERVRICVVRCPLAVGVVQRLSRDTLVLGFDGPETARGYAVSSLRALEVWRPEPRLRSGWQRGRRGLAAGALIGAVWCLADAGCLSADVAADDEMRRMAGAALAGGSIGLTLGVSSGLLFPAYRWEAVPLPTRAAAWPVAWLAR